MNIQAKRYNTLWKLKIVNILNEQERLDNRKTWSR